MNPTNGFSPNQHNNHMRFNPIQPQQQQQRQRRRQQQLHTQQRHNMYYQSPPNLHEQGALSDYGGAASDMNASILSSSVYTNHFPHNYQPPLPSHITGKVLLEQLHGNSSMDFPGSIATMGSNMMTMESTTGDYNQRNIKQNSTATNYGEPMTYFAREQRLQNHTLIDQANMGQQNHSALQDMYPFTSNMLL